MSKFHNFKVGCPCGKQFDIRVELIETSKNSTIQKYCPHCNEMVNVNVPGEPPKNDEVLRGLK